MLNFFKKGLPDRYITLLLFALILWLPVLTNERQLFSVHHPFLNISYQITGIYSYLIYVLLFVLIIISSFTVNHLANESEFTGQQITLAMFFFLVLIFSFPGFTVSAPEIIVNLIIIFIFGNLFKLSEASNQISLAFDSGFLLGLCSLVFFPLVFLLLLIWVAFLIHRANSWRNYLVSLLGLLTPYLFLVTWLFWTNQLALPGFFNEKIFTVSFIWIEQTTWPEKIIFILIFVLTAISFTKALTEQIEKNIVLRRNLMIVEYGIVIIFLVILLYSRELSTGVFLTAPAAWLMAHATYTLKKTKWMNLILTSLIVLIIINSVLTLIRDNAPEWLQ
ncbi:MAG: hypothetical protein GXO86_04125 [Chlorobi bacterium]|nr:hypothetical protein [Chlorobiota bacterium]